GVVLAGVALYLHKRAATVEYAVRQINEAVAAGEVEQLERWVDFAGLSDRLAASMAGVQPGAGQDARQRYRSIVQHKLQEVFAKGGGGHGGGGGLGGGHGGGSPAGAPVHIPDQIVPMEDEVFDILKKPIRIVPQNLLEQLKERPLTIQVQDEDMAILSTTVEHAALKQDFVLRLVMRRTDQGWRLNSFGNSDQLVGGFLNRISELQTVALEAFEQENDRQRLLMDTYYSVDACQAAVFPPDAAGVARLRITLKGNNLGERDMLTSGMLCEMFDRSGAKLASLRLENNRVVAAGGAFEHAWFYNFEEQYAEVKALIAAGTVRCVATPTAVSLGRGSMLHLRNAKDFPGVRLE
ncbi:MAG: hypothetical protein LBC10_02515, partial [Deltaproteobacteria bacterium]|nr:hypothetical protein [Deltaproteobacteria bacterium]